MNSRFKNAGLWTAIAAIVIMAVGDLTNITPEKIEVYVYLVLGALASAGVINNPKDGTGFLDRALKSKLKGGKK